MSMITPNANCLLLLSARGFDIFGAVLSGVAVLPSSGKELESCPSDMTIPYSLGATAQTRSVSSTQRSGVDKSAHQHADGLDPLRLWDRPLVPRVARVESPSRLEQHDVNLLFGDGSVFNTSRHNQEFSLLQPRVAVPKFHPETPLDHQEEFILVVMLVPDELTLEFHQFDL